MGEANSGRAAEQSGELTVISELNRCLAVDPNELQEGSRRLGWIAGEVYRVGEHLRGVDLQLQGANTVPGGALSAAPTRNLLQIAIVQLWAVHRQVGGLSENLCTAAHQYEEAESFARRVFTGVQDLRAAWRGIYGPGPVPPVQLARTSLGRFYSAAVRARRKQLSPTQRWVLGGQGQGILTEAGLVYYHQVAALGPSRWPQYLMNFATAAQLLPTALEPLGDLDAAGVNREQAALLAQSLSGTIVPDGDVGDGAAFLADRVADLHALMGHQGIRIQAAPARAGDEDPQRRPVRTFESALAVMEELDPGAGAQYGELRIDRVTSAQGEHSWQVFIPGGQGLDPKNVHSLLHSVSAVDSNYTPSVVMVAQALREVGAVKGEPIVITGHSHGGITGSLMANDPRIRAEFDVALVITAGSPIDRHEIRPDTHVLSFEHTEDPIPGVDGVASGAKPGLTRVERTLADSTDPAISQGRGIFHTHDYPGYIDTARIADGAPELAHVRGLFEGIIPEGQVRTYRFRGEID